MLNERFKNIISNYFPLIENSADLEFLPELLELYKTEFAVSFNFSPELLDKICYLGYFPMAGQFQIEEETVTLFLIKNHDYRCLIDLNKMKPPKSLKRYAKNLSITSNKNFKECVDGINLQHGEISWFYKELVDSFEILFEQNKYITKVHSIEVYEENALVAGELGYSVGSSYTSLSGFYKKSSSGTIQLFALAQILKENNFKLWDMGMVLDYKLRLGAYSVPRSAYLNYFYMIRDEKIDFHIPERKIIFNNTI